MFAEEDIRIKIQMFYSPDELNHFCPKHDKDDAVFETLKKRYTMSCEKTVTTIKGKVTLWS